MFEVDPHLSDWDFDSDDWELVNVRTTVNKDGGKEGNLPRKGQGIHCCTSSKSL